MKADAFHDTASSALTLLDEMRDRFEAACKSAGRRGALPSPHSYLDQVPEYTGFTVR